MFGKITFIVPVYNAGLYLESCIDSIINLKYKNIEIIIIDDGSKDDSYDVARRCVCKDNRVKLLAQSNRGASAARNRGLDLATGDWIVFIDADDWVEPDLCDVLGEGQSADIVYFGFYEHRKGDIIKKSIGSCSLNDSATIDSALVELFISKELFFGYTWNKFYRKSIINKHNLRFDESLFIKEDEEFIIRYCRNISSLYISDALPYNYRVLQNSISHKKLKYRNMTGLAVAIEKDLIDYPWKSFRLNVINSVYDYYLWGVVELRGKAQQSEAIDLFINFVDKNKSNLRNDLPFRYLFKTRYRSVKRFLIKTLPHNPIFIRLRPSYVRLQLCKITSLFVKIS